MFFTAHTSSSSTAGVMYLVTRVGGERSEHVENFARRQSPKAHFACLAYLQDFVVISPFGAFNRLRPKG